MYTGSMNAMRAQFPKHFVGGDPGPMLLGFAGGGEFRARHRDKGEVEPTVQLGDPRVFHPELFCLPSWAETDSRDFPHGRSVSAVDHVQA
jgi:hypothetical protein